MLLETLVSVSSSSPQEYGSNQKQLDGHEFSECLAPVSGPSTSVNRIGCCRSTALMDVACEELHKEEYPSQNNSPCSCNFVKEHCSVEKYGTVIRCSTML